MQQEGGGQGGGHGGRRWTRRWAFLRPVMRAQVRRGGGPAQPMIATGNAKIAGSLYNCRCLTAVIHGYTSNDTKLNTQTPQAFKILYFLADGFLKYI